MQSLYIDLLPKVDAAPRPMHLGVRIGRNSLIAMTGRFFGGSVSWWTWARCGRRAWEACWKTDRGSIAEDWAGVERSCRASSARVPLGLDTSVVGPAGIVRQTAWFSVISFG